MEFRGMRKGGNAPVNGNQCTVEVGSSGIDVLTFQLGPDDRVRSDADVVFYNQPASPEGAVRLTGPGTVTVYLELVPESVATVAIAVAAADDGARSALSGGLDVTVTTDSDGYRWSPTSLRTERAAILAELYRRNGVWKLRNVSAGWEQGLPALFTHFGVAVDDGAEAPVQTPPPPAPAPATLSPTPAVSPAPAGAVARPASPVAPAKKLSARKRIAWAAVVLVALLALASILGRKSDTTQKAAQPVPAAAPVSTASPARLSATPPPTLSSPAPSTTASAARSTASATDRAEPLLAAPAPVPLVRTTVAAQSAVVVLQRLRVAGRAAKTGYNRAQFGQAWTDDAAVDSGHNGCDTRNDILRRDLRKVVIRAGSHGCAVTAGTLADPYTGKVLSFTSSRAATVQIDHVVALSDAWQTGAQQLSPQQRQDLANDPLNLQATLGTVNQAKGDGDAASWLPPDKAYRCTYVARQVAVKARYGLWVTPAERQVISTVLIGCGAAPATPVPTPSRAPTPVTTRAPSTAAAIVPAPSPRSTVMTVRSTTTPAPAPTRVEQPAATSTTTEQASTEESTAAADAGASYANCTEARAAGVTPLHRGDPGYAPHLDRDDDGIACE